MEPRSVVCRFHIFFAMLIEDVLLKGIYRRQFLPADIARIHFAFFDDKSRPFLVSTSLLMPIEVSLSLKGLCAALACSELVLLAVWVSRTLSLHSGDENFRATR